MSIAAGICEASPPSASQWAERLCTPGCSIRRFQRRPCRSRLPSARHRRHRRVNGLNGFAPRLFYSTLSASPMSIAAPICKASPPPASQWAGRLCTPGCSIRRFQRRPCRSRLPSARHLRHRRVNGLNGFAPRLFYSTLSASPMSIAAPICKASPPSASQWAERLCTPVVLFDAFSVAHVDRGSHLQGIAAIGESMGWTALHPGLFYSTLSASPMSIAAPICKASPPSASQWAERHGHSQSPRAARRTRPRRGSDRSARGANPGEDRICRKAQP